MTTTTKKRGPGRPRIGAKPLTASEKMQRYRERLERDWNAAYDAYEAAQRAADAAEQALDQRLAELYRHDRRLHAATMAAAADQPHEPLKPLLDEHKRLTAIVREAQTAWKEAAAQRWAAADALHRADRARDRAA